MIYTASYASPLGGIVLRPEPLPPKPALEETVVVSEPLADTDLPHPFDTDRADELRAVLAERFASRTRQEWADVFADVDACVTPVLSPWEAHEHPHNVARGTFVTVGGRRQPAPAPRFSRTPADVPGPAPSMAGADTGALLAAAGLDADTIAELRARGVVG